VLIVYSGPTIELIDQDAVIESLETLGYYDLLQGTDQKPSATWAVRCHIPEPSDEVVEACGIYTRILMRNYQVFICVGLESLKQVTGLDDQKRGTLFIGPVPHIYYPTVDHLLKHTKYIHETLEEVETSLASATPKDNTDA
jgi:hypothetical protein